MSANLSVSCPILDGRNLTSYGRNARVDVQVKLLVNAHVWRQLCYWCHDKVDAIVQWFNVHMLWLSTPNIVLMDLTISLFLSYLIKLTYGSHTVPMLLFSFHTHASCTPHLVHLHAVHGYVLPFFASILPPPCSCLISCFVSIPLLCLMHTDTGIF